MIDDIRSFEDAVYDELEDKGESGLQPGSAKDLLSKLSDDPPDGRMEKLLEQLAGEDLNKFDRAQITTSLLQLCEAYREQEEDEEAGLAGELFELAGEAKSNPSDATECLHEGLTKLGEADGAVFEDAEIARDEAVDFLLDLQDEVDDEDQPQDVIAYGLNNIGNAL